MIRVLNFGKRVIGFALVLLPSSGCSRSLALLSHSVHLGDRESERAEINKVKAEILPQLNAIPDRPVSSLALIRSLEAYTKIYDEASTTKCPEDFRKQFYANRRATAESATELQEEYMYFMQHPEEDPDRGGSPSLQAIQLSRGATTAMQDALSQHEELQAIAQKYGVAWP